ncbi:MAG: dipeptidase PepE [Thermoanaerobaculia bacterium]|nr:dipeptidase PepE [Thermoanaerobaculia bacterium]
MSENLLLISNSTMHGGEYLAHCRDALREILDGRERLTFVPYALADHDGYAAKAAEGLAPVDVQVDSIHRFEDPVEAVRNAEALFIGGGNTFRLLRALYEKDLMEPIRERAAGGMPYIGSSAGSNVACWSIRTTNDMPIVEPPSFDALRLVTFNLNPHYLDPDPGSRHMGETREERIVQFLEENDRIVVGLREGAWLRVRDGSIVLGGTTGARIFRRGLEPSEHQPGESLDWLFQS